MKDNSLQNNKLIDIVERMYPSYSNFMKDLICGVAIAFLNNQVIFHPTIKEYHQKLISFLNDVQVVIEQFKKN